MYELSIGCVKVKKLVHICDPTWVDVVDLPILLNFLIFSSFRVENN